MKDLFEIGETLKFDEVVERLNEKDGTKFDAGEFSLGNIFQEKRNQYHFDNGIDNVVFTVEDEDLVSALYDEDVRIKDFYEL